MQPCLKVISACYPPCFKPYLPNFARKVYWIVAIQTRGRRILLNTAANDGSRRLAFMHVFARSLCSPHCILTALVNCVVTTRCDISILLVSFLVSLCNWSQPTLDLTPRHLPAMKVSYRALRLVKALLSLFHLSFFDAVLMLVSISVIGKSPDSL